MAAGHRKSDHSRAGQMRDGWFHAPSTARLAADFTRPEAHYATGEAGCDWRGLLKRSALLIRQHTMSAPMIHEDG